MKRVLVGPAVLACALILVGCGRRPGPENPSPRPFNSQGPAMPSLLSIREQREDGTVSTRDDSGVIAVDINSIVEIRPSAEALRRFYAIAAGPEPANPAVARVRELSDSLEVRRQAFIAMDRELSGVMSGISAAAEVLTRNPNDAAAENQLRSALAKQAGLVEPAIRILGPRSPAVDSALADPVGGYGKLAQALRADVDATDARLNQAIREMDRVAQDQAPRVRMWAIRAGRGRDAARLHLPGYDDLPAGNPDPVDKLGFSRTEAEQAALDRSHAIARGTESAIDAMVTAGNTTLSNAAQFVTVVRKSVDSLATIAGKLPDSATIAVLKRGLTLDPQSALTQALDSIWQALAPLQSVLVLRTRLSDYSVDSPDAAFELLRDAAVKTGEAVNQLTDTAHWAGILRRAADTLGGAARGALATATAPEATRLQELVDRAVSWRALADSATRLLTSTEALKQALERARDLVALGRGLVGFRGPPLSTAEPTEHLTDVLALEAAPTNLDLTRAQPLEGDRVTIHFRVIDGRTAATMAERERTLVVHTYGLHRRWSGGLAYARPESDHFQPAVGTSWILHYGRRPGEPDPLGLKHLLAEPALGLGLTTLVFTHDTDLQLGMGGTATLFQDIVQIGGGYNFSSEKWYFMVMTSLSDLFRQVGSGSGGG